MVVDIDLRSYADWLLTGTGGSHRDGALLNFAITFGAIALLALIGGFVVQLIRYGPMKAGELTYRGLTGGVADLLSVSPRRVSALAYLAVKESLRRRAPIALAVFALILVFAGWFLQTNYQDPAKLNVSFVLSATSYLLLALGLLLSTFSLPNDFESRTIYTIVTKPVRHVDIVLGRVLGFGLIGTVMLLLMGLGGYLFVNRTLDHEHLVEQDSLANVAEGGELARKEGQTSEAAYHRHEVVLDAEGGGYALSHHGHEHEIAAGQTGEARTSGSLRALRARVPQLGRISFLGRNGQPTKLGVNTGKEWTYRSSIEGGTGAAAVWRFEGVTEASLLDTPDGKVLPIELFIRVFRTHKGNLERGIQGTLQLQNPDNPDVKTSVRPFSAKDGQYDSFAFATEQYDTGRNPIRLMEDLVSKDGRIDVVLQALDRSQYFSVAQADCYIKRPDGSPAWNYAKGCLCIWAQMMVVITIGVAASTFLNGPIATLLTVATILLGFSREFFVNVAKNEEWGGGPVESLVRMVTHMNVMTPFENPDGSQTLPVALMKGSDAVLQTFMQGVALLLPDFPSLSTADYVARGFSAPGPLVGRSVSIALAYVLGMTVAGLFLMRSREIAKD